MLAVTSDSPAHAGKLLAWRRRMHLGALLGGALPTYLEWRGSNEYTLVFIGVTLTVAAMGYMWGRMSYVLIQHFPDPEWDDSAKDVLETVERVQQLKLVLAETQHASGLERKRNAGSHSSLRTEVCTKRTHSIHGVRSTGPSLWLDTPSLAIGLLADCVVTVGACGIQRASYKDVRPAYTKFIMQIAGRPPSDTYVVGQTWAKVTKSGERDRRYKDNYQLHQCEFARLEFEAPGLEGFSLIFSEPGAAILLETFVLHRGGNAPPPDPAVEAPCTPLNQALAATFGAAKAESEMQRILGMYGDLLALIAGASKTEIPNDAPLWDMLHAAPERVIHMMLKFMETNLRRAMRSPNGSDLKLLKIVCPAYIQIVMLEAHLLLLSSPRRSAALRPVTVELAQFFAGRGEIGGARTIRKALLAVKIEGAAEALSFVEPAATTK